MKYIIMIAAVVFVSCVSVWPRQCTHDWRGRVECKCTSEIKFQITNHEGKKRLLTYCDGEALPISVDATQVVL